MSNSGLICYTKLSPNCGERTHKIDTVSIHCMAGNGSIETCGNLFSNPSYGASSNYGIGSDGRIALYVPEDKRSWCTSNRENDNRAVTIEVANCGGAPDWPVSDKAMESLIALLVDICQRNGIPRLLWKNDKNLIGQVEKQNMTVHCWFAAKACPGNYLLSRHGEIAGEVNRRLEDEEMRKKAAETVGKEGVKMEITNETIQQLLKTMSPLQCYELLKKAQEHAATLPLPDWAQGETKEAKEYAEAKESGITDGTRPMGLVTRLEAALMALRARKGA